MRPQSPSTDKDESNSSTDSGEIKHPQQEAVIVELGEPSESSTIIEDPTAVTILSGDEANYRTVSVQLYQAAMKGDWKTAKNIITKQQDIVRKQINNTADNPLHIAVAAKHKGFVRNLLKEMKTEDLIIRNKNGDTPLSFAAVSGVVEIANMLIEKHPSLPNITSGELTPIHMAAVFGHRKMVKYLYHITDMTKLGDVDMTLLFHAMISADMYGLSADIALWMLQKSGRRKEVLTFHMNGKKQIALELMSPKTSAISHKRQLNIFQKSANSISKGFFRDAKKRTLAYLLVEELWKSVVQLPMEEVSIFLRTHRRLLFDAVESGNVEFLVILIRSHPDIIWTVDEQHRSIFQVAILYRHQKIFNIIYEFGAMKDLIASSIEHESGNTLLHLVARLPHANRLSSGGAAFQMQSELLWFEAVEEIVPHSYRKIKNNADEVAHDLFTEQHENLRKQGEKWMKETATACMLVATLIATVVFAAALSVPGGYVEGTTNQAGLPRFRNNNFWFDMFILSDSVALLLSVTSIVIFLSILTSRYAEDDFRRVLPMKLMLGLITLFFSIISMVLAFTLTMILIGDKKLTWTLILITILASFAYLVITFLQFKIRFYTFRATLLANFLGQGHKYGLF